MHKFIILIMLSFNFSNLLAETRITPDQTSKINEKIKMTVSKIVEDELKNPEIKSGEAVLQKIKPKLQAYVKKLEEQRRISSQLANNIFIDYEKILSESKSESNFDKEKLKGTLVIFCQNQFDQINKYSSRNFAKENESCVFIKCGEGLVCFQQKILNRLKEKNKPFVNGAICVKPNLRGESCSNKKPICERGTLCRKVDLNTNGVGECLAAKDSCKSGSECCSNSCQNNKCVPSFTCQDGRKNGQTLKRGQYCEKGLIPINNICSPDFPPLVIPQVKMFPLKKLINIFAEIIIPSANAFENPGDAIRRQRAAEARAAEDRAAAAARAAAEARATLTIQPPTTYIMTTGSSSGSGSDSGSGSPVDPAAASNAASYFRTCEFDLRYLDLQDGNLLKLQKDLWSFEFVNANNPDDSFGINQSLKNIAQKSKNKREAMNQTFLDMNKNLRCVCLDAKGFDKINSNDQTFFKNNCDQYSAISTQTAAERSLNQGDATGIKQQKLILDFDKAILDLYVRLTIDNTEIYTNLANLRDKVSLIPTQLEGANTIITSEKLYDDYIKRPDSWWGDAYDAIADVVQGIFLYGYIFDFYEWLTELGSTSPASATQDQVSLIELKAASMTGSGANTLELILDKYKQEDCGALWGDTCTYYHYYLKYTSNNFCGANSNFNSSACIKRFMIVKKDGKQLYLIDPSVPLGIPNQDLSPSVSGGRNYIESLNEAFNGAFNYLKSHKQKTSKDFENNVLLKFGINFDDANKFLLTDALKQKILDSAIAFAKLELRFNEEDAKNWADDTYEKHFLDPKISAEASISYLPPGLLSYLEFMSNGVGSLGAGAGNGVIANGDRYDRYEKREDYYNKTVETYGDKAIHQEPDTKVELDPSLSQIGGDPSFDIGSTKLNPNLALGYDTKGSKLQNSSIEYGKKAFNNAIATLRSARKTQLKKLDAYNKAMKESGNADRAKRVASAAKKYAARLGNPLSGSSFGSSQGLFGSSGAGGLKLENSKSDGQKNPNGSGDNYNTFSLGSGGRDGNGTNSSDNSGKDEASLSNSQAGGENSISSEDARRLAEAIEARNKANKDRYQSHDDQTLFEQVTNAYIRNYDKVLILRKKID